MSHRKPDRMRDSMPDKMPYIYRMSDKMPGHMSERMPQQLSDRMQNEMPELSEYMPASQIEC